MSGFISRFARDPAGFLARAIYKTVIAPLKYRRKGGYDADRYWRDRFARHGMSLKGVGDEGLSDEENREMYRQAAGTFLGLCERERVDFARARVLEIGCGNGFYTGILRDQGVKNYAGVDITDIFFSDLAGRFPGFRFLRRDVTADRLEGEFDLILMIDVIEHITEPDKLRAAFDNVKNHLAKGGLFLVAPVPEKGKRSLFYVRFWSHREIASHFEGYDFRESVPFRYNRILPIRKP